MERRGALPGALGPSLPCLKELHAVGAMLEAWGGPRLMMTGEHSRIWSLYKIRLRKLARGLGSGLGVPPQDIWHRGRCGYRQNIPVCIWSLVSGQTFFLPCLPAAASPSPPLHICQGSSMMTCNLHMWPGRKQRKTWLSSGWPTGTGKSVQCGEELPALNPRLSSQANSLCGFDQLTAPFWGGPSSLPSRTLAVLIF